MAKSVFSTRIYGLLTGDDDARVCKDIPDSACNDQPRNYILHLLSLIATKIGDELASARLVLPWLITTIGGPASLIGLLVPIRESGALLPQLLIAGYIRPHPIRKWFWVIGSIVQGVCVGLLAVAAMLLDAVTATWSIVVLITVFSLARGVCSVAQKDVVGKTVSKFRRGRLSGYSAGIAGVATVVIGIYLSQASTNVADIVSISVILFIGAGLWLLASILFANLHEVPGATGGGANGIRNALESFQLLKTDVQLRYFVTTRALLISTALLVPFIVALISSKTSSSAAELGILIIASGIAGSLSSPIWGRLSDRSSRLVLIIAALVAGLSGLVVYLLSLIAVSIHFYVYTLIFMVFVIAHSGIRIGRQTYLVDMATQDNRAAYVALSNTLIGALLLVMGAISAAVALKSLLAAVLLLSVLALFGAISAIKLAEVHNKN